MLERGHLSLSPRRVWVDCLAFEQLADSVGAAPGDAVRSAAAAAAQRAMTLYGGPFLHDTDDHAWQLVCRTRLASKFKQTVALLVGQAGAGGDRRFAGAPQLQLGPRRRRPGALDLALDGRRRSCGRRECGRALPPARESCITPA